MTPRLARRLAGWLLLLLLLPAACSFIDVEETGAPGLSATPPAPAPSATSVFPAPGAPVSMLTLTVWLPARFAPGSPAGDLLQARLDEFAGARPGLRIDLRLKQEDGLAGPLDSLRAAHLAAPATLPDLALLSRADLESAIPQGWLTAPPAWASALEDPDWFDYARALARSDGALYGLPFAGDAPVLVYRPAELGAPELDWESMRARGLRLVFPAGDPRAALALSLYLSAAPNPNVTLDPQALERALTALNDWRSQGLLVEDVTRYSLDAEAWAVFADGRAAWIVTGSARVPPGSDPALSVVPLPGLDGVPAALADGWLWTLPGPDESRRALAIELAEYLTAPDFLAVWSESAGVLPVRPSSLPAWSDDARRSATAAVVQSARGPSAQTALVAPLARQALLAVLSGEIDPAGAAQAVFERLK